MKEQTMSDNLKVAKECGFLVAAEAKNGYVLTGSTTAFEAYTSRILASQQAAHEAEIAKLREEIARQAYGWRIANREALDCRLQLASAKEACAMKDEALKYAIEDLTIRAKLSDDDSLNIGQGALDKMHEAISASPQQVSEWERKQLEPLQSRIEVLEADRPHWAMGHTSDGVAAQMSSSALSALWKLLGVSNQTEAVAKLTEIVKAVEPLRAQVAMLNTLVGKAAMHVRPTCTELYEQLIDGHNHTQATAEQFIAECKQREAVKVLEELLPEIHKARDTGSVWGKVKEKIAELRATSKKAG